MDEISAELRGLGRLVEGGMQPDEVAELTLAGGEVGSSSVVRGA